MAICRCHCHAPWTPREQRQFVQAVLGGQTLARVAEQAHTNTFHLREIITALCYEANAALWLAERERMRALPSLRFLRAHKEAFGFAETAHA